MGLIINIYEIIKTFYFVFNNINKNSNKSQLLKEIDIYGIWKGPYGYFATKKGKNRQNRKSKSN